MARLWSLRDLWVHISRGIYILGTIHRLDWLVVLVDHAVTRGKLTDTFFFVGRDEGLKAIEAAGNFAWAFLIRKGVNVPNVQFVRASHAFGERFVRFLLQVAAQRAVDAVTVNSCLNSSHRKVVRAYSAELVYLR